MTDWNDFYSCRIKDFKPALEIVRLSGTLKGMGIVDVLDVGCGTGRNSLYLAKQGFNVHGCDISAEAIQIAMANRNGYKIEYRVAANSDLPYGDESMDFIFVNHSLEYGTEEEIRKSLSHMDRILRKDCPIFLRVDSTKHPYNGIDPKKVEVTTHMGFCIQNGIPIHFFSEAELRKYFQGYKIGRLEEITEGEIGKNLISEFVLLAYKQ